MTLIEKLTAMRKSWAMVFQVPTPTDDILMKWLGIAPMDVIDRAFIKVAGWPRSQRVAPTQKQLEKRIKNTLFWLQTTSGVAHANQMSSLVLCHDGRFAITIHPSESGVA